MGGWDAPWHWVIVALVVLVLFGYKKLPDASRSIGRSLRIFKTEIKGMSEDDKARTANAEPAAIEAAQAAQTSAPIDQHIAVPPVVPAASVVPQASAAPVVAGQNAPAAPARPRPSPFATPAGQSGQVAQSANGRTDAGQ